jgi:hypothetical protein
VRYGSHQSVRVQIGRGKRARALGRATISPSHGSEFRLVRTRARLFFKDFSYISEIRRAATGYRTELQTLATFQNELRERIELPT